MSIVALWATCYYMNQYARFDEIPSMTLKDIKEKNVMDERTEGWTDGQRENSIPTHKHSLQGV